MRGLSSYSGFLLDTVDYPGPDGAILDDFRFGIPVVCRLKKRKKGAIRSDFGSFPQLFISRKEAKISPYDPQLSGVLPEISTALLAAPRYSRRVLAALSASTSTAANSSNGFMIPLSYPLMVPTTSENVTRFVSVKASHSPH